MSSDTYSVLIKYPNGELLPVLTLNDTISSNDAVNYPYGKNLSYISTIAPQVQPNSSIYFAISNGISYSTTELLLN
jgi:hypothetical protein